MRNAAIVGLGAIAEHHAKALAARPEVKLQAGVTRTPAKLEAFCERHRIPDRFRGVEDLLASPRRPDFAVVCVNDLAIFDVAKRLLEAGIPCLIEKPAGTSPAETAALAAVARLRAVPAMVGVNRRFYDNIRAGLDAIRDAGGLKAMVVEATERLWQVVDVHPAPLLDAWIYANGVHCVDLMCHAGGVPADLIVRSTRGRLPREVGLDALVTFPGGATGHYFSHWYAPGGWGLTLIAEKTRVEVRPLETTRILRHGQDPLEIGLSERDRALKPGFAGQADAFVRWLESGRKPPFACDLDEATEVMRVLERLDRAARGG